MEDLWAFVGLSFLLVLSGLWIASSWSSWAILLHVRKPEVQLFSVQLHGCPNRSSLDFLPCTHFCVYRVSSSLSYMGCPLGMNLVQLQTQDGSKMRLRLQKEEETMTHRVLLPFSVWTEFSSQKPDLKTNFKPLDLENQAPLQREHNLGTSDPRRLQDAPKTDKKDKKR